ncbi:hypothetical protein [Mucilaginibacter lacusdianchii]|uniref:hypothetical protein n=1 Tax=Mucilaginibacter lacusdianchii TaxID=2684211 RepID=UPI00131ADE97|nr:hypothetical protein [Mucilaginibacter sp. JXJ CY 39]
MTNLPSNKTISSDKETLLWTFVVLNNLIAATLLGISFLAGPSAQTPYWRVVLGLATYVIVIAGISSLISFLLLRKVREQQGRSKWRVFTNQFVVLVFGYLLVFFLVYFVQFAFR